MDGSYRLNINSQNIVQSAARERAVSTAVVQKMTQQKAAIRVFRRTVYGTNCQLACSMRTGGIGFGAPHPFNFCRHNRAAEIGGFLLGNAHRCGVAVERVKRAGNVIHDFIVAAAKDSSEAAAADSRFADIFLAVALASQDADAFPSCRVVI